MSDYVITLNKEEFSVLNWKSNELVLHRKRVGRKCPLTYLKKPKEVYIALRNGGKKDRLIFTREVAEIDNFDEIKDNFKASELNYTKVEEIVVNGMIPATALLTKVDTKEKIFVLSDLEILGAPKKVSEFGLKKVPPIFAKAKKKVKR